MNGKCERKFNCMASWQFIFCHNCIYLGIMLHFSVYFTGNIEKAAEVQTIVPSIGRNNSHTFVVQTYNKSEVNLCVCILFYYA